MSRILIVEDEHGIALFIAKGLRAASHTTMVVEDGRTAIDVATDRDFDLVILDLGLPDVDGRTVLEAIRRRGEQLPVVILSARSDVEDTVDGLEGGADDYVTKPFRFEELLARVRARLRDRGTSEPSVLEGAGITLDVRTRKVHVGEHSPDLSGRQFALLELFMRHPEQVLSRQQILSQVWGYDYDPGSNVVDVYVGYLRRKLGHERIETVRGVGYRLGDSADAES